VPERYLQNRYMMMVHGCGLVDDCQHRLRARFADWGYDGIFVENMVVSVGAISARSARGVSSSGGLVTARRRAALGTPFATP
jgi:hypothetical protein